MHSMDVAAPRSSTQSPPGALELGLLAGAGGSISTWWLAVVAVCGGLLTAAVWPSRLCCWAMAVSRGFGAGLPSSSFALLPRRATRAALLLDSECVTGVFLQGVQMLMTLCVCLSMGGHFVGPPGLGIPGTRFAAGLAQTPALGCPISHVCVCACATESACTAHVCVTVSTPAAQAFQQAGCIACGRSPQRVKSVPTRLQPPLLSRSSSLQL